jgi:hypothetical protein
MLLFLDYSHIYLMLDKPTVAFLYNGTSLVAWLFMG